LAGRKPANWQTVTPFRGQKVKVIRSRESKQLQFCSEAHSWWRHVMNKFTNIGVKCQKCTNSLRRYIHLYFPLFIQRFKSSF